ELRNSSRCRAVIAFRPGVYTSGLGLVGITPHARFVKGVNKRLHQPLARKARRQPGSALDAARRPVGRPPRGPVQRGQANKASLERSERLSGATRRRQRAEPPAKGRPADLLGEETERFPVGAEGESFEQRLPERFLLTFPRDDRDERGRLTPEAHVSEPVQGGGDLCGPVSRQRREARLPPESRPLEPAHDLVRTALDPASQRRDRRRPPAGQGRRPPLVVPEDNVEDDPRVGGIALVAVPLKIAAAHVQLDVSLEQAARRGDQRIKEVRSCPAAEPPPVDYAQLFSPPRDQRLRRERLVPPEAGQLFLAEIHVPPQGADQRRVPANGLGLSPRHSDILHGTVYTQQAGTQIPTEKKNRGHNRCSNFYISDLFRALLLHHAVTCPTIPLLALCPLEC